MTKDCEHYLGSEISIIQGKKLLGEFIRTGRHQEVTRGESFVVELEGFLKQLLLLRLAMLTIPTWPGIY